MTDDVEVVMVDDIEPGDEYVERFDVEPDDDDIKHDGPTIDNSHHISTGGGLVE